MSAEGQEATSRALVDHLVSGHKQCLRNREAKRRRRLGIDRELEFRWKLNRQILWLFAFENSVRVARGFAKQVGTVRSVRNKAASLDEIADGIDRWNAKASGQ